MQKGSYNTVEMLLGLQMNLRELDSLNYQYLLECLFGNFLIYDSQHYWKLSLNSEVQTYMV